MVRLLIKLLGPWGIYILLFAIVLLWSILLEWLGRDE